MEDRPWWKICLISCGKGLLALESTDLECGAVLFLREASMGRVLMAQKNPRDGYVFSGLWVLPGGMIRETDPRVEEARMETAEECGSRFIRKRVVQETGLEIDRASLHALRDPCHWVPPVTCYQARGETRYVLVLPFSHEPLPVPPPGLVPHCASIQSVCWRDPLDCWGEIAPANQIILANCLWTEWTPEQRASVRPALEKAREQCTRWAQEVGFKPPTVHF